MVCLDLTYEELKRGGIDGLTDDEWCLDLTYEELKLATVAQRLMVVCVRLDLTYEELKRRI